MDTTFRVVSLKDDNVYGKTAINPEFAMLVAGDLPRSHRLGMERTDWTDNSGRPKVQRTVLVDVEGRPGEWTLGA